MKVVALYLPQYHKVKENDEWWGEGFTEWTAVKSAKPLFKGHLQPHIPIEEEYYDLLEKNTLIHQAELLVESGLDGFCMYHYWFKDGRKILEKPAENLLEWKDINIPFCFSWANETWARTWSNLTEKNVWASEFEKKSEIQDTGILLDQKYGNESDWEKHFQYLLPFFNDVRYLKIEGKPIFVIHKADSVSCLENMIECWRKLATENGLAGLYIIGNNVRESQKDAFDEIMISEPGDAMQRSSCTIRGGVKCYNYDEIWKRIIETDMIQATSLGAFVGYDDTPRRGINGSVIEYGTPEKFANYISKLIRMNRANNVEVMFVNAWNEWGEGMYLEPDIINKEKYINGIRDALDNALSNYKEENIAICNTIPYRLYKKEQNFKNRERHLERIMDKWMRLRENNADILENMKYKKVVLYGCGLLGKHLLFDMAKEGVEVVGIIDRNPFATDKYQVFSPDGKWPDCDIIIVTATYDYGYIYKKIKDRNLRVTVLSLEYLIMEK